MKDDSGTKLYAYLIEDDRWADAVCISETMSDAIRMWMAAMEEEKEPHKITRIVKDAVIT